MSFLLRSVATLALTTLPLAALAAPAPDCSLAQKVDAGSYAALKALGGGGYSEASEDAWAAQWAECSAQQLKRELATQPQLLKRIDTFREQYRELRALESYFAYVRAGGGTMHTHAVPRAYPQLEEQLSSLAHLAASPLGGQQSAGYADALKAARAQQLEFAKQQQAYRPDDIGQLNYDGQTWKANVKRYLDVSNALMRGLGSRPDNATALGYSIMTNHLFEIED